jgi:hypothetical protein
MSISAFFILLLAALIIKISTINIFVTSRQSVALSNLLSRINLLFGMHSKSNLFYFFIVWVRVILTILATYTAIEMPSIAIEKAKYLGVFLALMSSFNISIVLMGYFQKSSQIHIALDTFFIKQYSLLVIVLSCIFIPYTAPASLPAIIANPLGFFTGLFLMGLRNNFWFESISLDAKQAILPISANCHGLELFGFDLGNQLEKIALSILIIKSFLIHTVEPSISSLSLILLAIFAINIIYEIIKTILLPQTKELEYITKSLVLSTTGFFILTYFWQFYHSNY